MVAISKPGTFSNKMNELQKLIMKALKLLIENDIELIKNQPREECINHRFAQWLEEVLKSRCVWTKLELNVDVEYDKYKEDGKKSSRGRNIRPDIIVHERKSGNKNNLMVIEAKKNYIDKKDKCKIMDLVKNKDFEYSLGAGVAYLPNRNYMKIKFFSSERGWENYQLDKDDFTIKKQKNEPYDNSI